MVVNVTDLSQTELCAREGGICVRGGPHRMRLHMSEVGSLVVGSSTRRQTNALLESGHTDSTVVICARHLATARCGVWVALLCLPAAALRLHMYYTCIDCTEVSICRKKIDTIWPLEQNYPAPRLIYTQASKENIIIDTYKI